MTDTIIFQIQARSTPSKTVTAELGCGSDVTETKGGCIWHLEKTQPVSKNQPYLMIMEMLEQFKEKKTFLKSLRENGSDLVIIWLPGSRDGFYTLGLKYDLMELLSGFGISLNCPYPKHA